MKKKITAGKVEKELKAHERHDKAKEKKMSKEMRAKRKGCS